MIFTNAPPNDIRYFFHKRLIKAATGFVTSGFNPLSAVGGFLAPQPRGPGRSDRPPGLPRTRTVQRRDSPFLMSRPQIVPVRRPAPRSLTARPGAASAAEKESGRASKFPGFSGNIGGVDFSIGGKRCIPPFFSDGQGGCELDLIPGSGGGGSGANRDIGQTVMGQYGAGEVPGNLVVNRAICRRGMVLGNDGVCYNRSQISNKEREWPRGRRPLLTGGDMRAISTAARAGKRLEGATKRLQKIGLMKKPSPRRVKLITSGSTEHHHHG